MADLEDLVALTALAETDVLHLVRPALTDPKDRSVTGKELREFNSTGNINAQVGTTYQLVLTDHGKVVTLNNGSAIAMTVPANATVAFPTGTMIELIQLGAGQVTITAGGGVTISTIASGLKMVGQYSIATLIKIDTDTWIAAGSLTA